MGLARTTTNKYRIENYDNVKAERDNLSLALHDLVNGKFSESVGVKETDYSAHGIGHYRVRVSERSNPLYLVEYLAPGDIYRHVSLFTESEIDSMWDNYCIFWVCMRYCVSRLKELSSSDANGPQSETVKETL